MTISLFSNQNICKNNNIFLRNEIMFCASNKNLFNFVFFQGGHKLCYLKVTYGEFYESSVRRTKIRIYFTFGDREVRTFHSTRQNFVRMKYSIGTIFPWVPSEFCSYGRIFVRADYLGSFNGVLFKM